MLSFFLFYSLKYFQFFWLFLCTKLLFSMRKFLFFTSFFRCIVDSFNFSFLIFYNLILSIGFSFSNFCIKNTYCLLVAWLRNKFSSVFYALFPENCWLCANLICRFARKSFNVIVTYLSWNSGTCILLSSIF